MKPSEEIAQLKQENQKLTEQVDGLKKRLVELETAKPKSKSRQQAEQGLEMDGRSSGMPGVHHGDLDGEFPGTGGAGATR
jgi:hypothetical protein